MTEVADLTAQIATALTARPIDATHLTSLFTQWASIIGAADATQDTAIASVDLATARGNLAVSHLNSGTSASSTSFWRGDGSWAVPSVGAASNVVGKNFVTDYGAVGDGSTENSSAMVAFNTFGKAETAAGRGAVLNVPPGVYNYLGIPANYWLAKIRKLRIVGYGAVFQQTYANQWVPWANSSSPRINPSYKINTTVAGVDTSVTLTTALNYTNFAVGDWVLICSGDIMGYGFPPDPDQLEFAQITGVNSTTGVLSIDRTIEYNHRSDFPEVITTQPIWGTARIFNLNVINNDNDPSDMGQKTNVWDVDHTFEGFEVRPSANPTETYFTTSGKMVRFINCILPGIAPSCVETMVVSGCRITDVCEPDKLCRRFLIDNSEFSSGLGFQSSSIENVRVNNTLIRNLFNPGSAKNVYVTNSEIETLGFAGVYGSNRSVTFENCVIHSVPNPIPMDGGGQTIDGTNVTFANGLITVKKGYSGASQYMAMPGTWVNFHTTYDGASGAQGCGIVLRTYDDATNVYLQTTLPFASVPSWSNGKIGFQKNGNLRFINCTGCDVVRMASDADKRGIAPWEFSKFTFAGQQGANNGQFPSVPNGRLKSVRVNVIQATAIANAKFTFTAYFPSSVTIAVDIDLTVTGVRNFTTDALYGKATNDDVLLTGVAQTAIPSSTALTVAGATYWGLSYVPASNSTYTLPTFEIEFIYDFGPLRSLVTAAKDGGGTALVPVVGTLP